MTLFWNTFLLIFFAEIADKSRVAGVLLVATFRARAPVFWGMTLGYALMEGAAVLLGGLLPRTLSGPWVERLAGILFAALGAAGLLLPAETEDRAQRWLRRAAGWGPFLLSFAIISAAEVADRTQLAAAALSARTGRPWVVYAGAMGALIVLNALTVWLGHRLLRKISPHLIRRLSSAIFLILGIFFFANSLGFYFGRAIR